MIGDGCSPASANYLLRDHKGRYFVTTNAGLFRYDPAADSFFNIHPTENSSIGNSLFGLAEDRYGTIWIGLDNGICAYDPDSNRVIRVMSEDNSIGPVERIAVDSMQNVWFRSISGYWCWLRRQGSAHPVQDQGMVYPTIRKVSSIPRLTEMFMRDVRRVSSGFTPISWARYSVTADVRIMDVFAGDRPLAITTGPQGEKTTFSPLRPNQHSVCKSSSTSSTTTCPRTTCSFISFSSAPGDWTPVDNGRLSLTTWPRVNIRLPSKGGNKLAGLF